MPGWLAVVVLMLLVGCTATETTVTATPGTAQTEPIKIEDLDVATGQTVYVPAYSEIYYAPGRTLGLAVTLSIHNTDLNRPIVVTAVRYYNAQGQLVKDFLAQPQQLGPLAAADFFVEQHNSGGGLGSNFIVEWVAERPVYEPVVEAVMIGTISSQGISFISPGRVVTQTGEKAAAN